MGKNDTYFEWHMGEADEHWPTLPPLAAGEDRMAATLAGRLGPLPSRRITVVVLLLSLVGIGGALWRTSAAGVTQIEQELAASVQLELWAAAQGKPVADADFADITWQRQVRQETANLPALLWPDLSGASVPAEKIAVTVQLVNLREEVAMVQTLATVEDRAIRQMRFYRRSQMGWQRIAPLESFWGTPQHLETESFAFRFRRHDAQAVAAVAPRIEAFYASLRRDFGLPLTRPGEKLTIEVSVKQRPGELAIWADTAHPLQVPSPSLYQAPARFTDAERLAQAIALPLLNQVSAQAAIPLHWRRMVLGLRLWHLWDMDMPLSNWQDDVVAWVYSEPTGQRPAALCAIHRLWMPEPATIEIPIPCDDTASLAARGARGTPPSRLAHFITPVVYWQTLWAEPPKSHSEAVALATLIDYAVTAYGREQLPRLIAQLDEHDNWHSLIPAVFGVSAGEFEQGWRLHLMRRYGMEPGD